jgi:hypothetical protein
VEDVKKFEQTTMKQLGKKVEIVIYPNAGLPLKIPTTTLGTDRMMRRTPGSGR